MYVRIVGKNVYVWILSQKKVYIIIIKLDGKKSFLEAGVCVCVRVYM